MRAWGSGVATSVPPFVRVWGARLWALAGVTAAAALVVLSFNGREPRGNGTSQGAAPRPSWIVHENEVAGYSFMSPPAWRATHRGSVSHVTSPRRSAVVSFGHQPSGTDLLPRARRLTTLLDRSYRAVRMRSPTFDTIGGHLAVMRWGRATNEAGEKLRVLVAAIRGPSRIYGVVAFEAVSMRLAEHDSIAEIAHSFRVEP